MGIVCSIWYLCTLAHEVNQATFDAGAALTPGSQGPSTSDCHRTGHYVNPIQLNRRQMVQRARAFIVSVSLAAANQPVVEVVVQVLLQADPSCCSCAGWASFPAPCISLITLRQQGGATMAAKQLPGSHLLAGGLHLHL